MLCYGINPILEALRSDSPPTKLLVHRGKDNKRLQHLRGLATKRDIPVQENADLDRLCGQNAVHQGVAGEFADTWYRPLEQLPDDVERLVVFDGIRDPHNFGAALRVCETFGFRHVLYHLGNSSGMTPVAAKTSSGAIFHLHLYAANLNKAMQALQQRGFSIYALDMAGQHSIHSVPLEPPFCLVIGSEGDGVRHNIRRVATAMVNIPMAGHIESLNVSCALSACLCTFAHRLDD